MKITVLMQRLIIVSVLLFAAVWSSHADDPIRHPDNGAAMTAAWSPDGRHIAVAQNGRVFSSPRCVSSPIGLD